MAEQQPLLETRITMIERALADLDTRLRAVESGARLSTDTGVPATDAGVSPLPTIDVAGTFALAGRVFVLLAGAYLLRALTESGALRPATGAIVGLVYALALTAIAYRVAPRQPASATLFGSCTVIIGFPLLWEATTRFGLLTPAACALAITATVAVILIVAWHRHLHALAWIATVGACLLASGLLVATGAPAPFAAFLIVLGVGTLWLGYSREWTGLRWVAAVFADLSALALIARAHATPPLDPPATAMGIQILLLLGYLGSIAIRTLVRKRDVLPFEATQTAAILAVGLAGAVWIAQRTAAAASTLGLTLLLLTVACYAVAFVHREWHARAANYYFYTSLALVFALIGGRFMFERAPAGVLWTLLAVIMARLAQRYRRTTLHVHAIVYLLAGAWTSGLAATVVATLFGPVAAIPSPVTPTAWLVVGAVLVCWWMALAPSSPADAHGAVTALTLLLVVAAAAVCVIVTRAMVFPVFDVTLRPALVATTRTAIFAAGAVLVAWLGTRPATRACGWLLYPIVGWGLLKLLFEDFRVSPASLLFVALGLYGSALILAPRLARRTPSTATPAIAQPADHVV